MSKKKPLLVICGPTAVGKTSLGIDLSLRLNGEIISADSRQVYKLMDIGTGKDVGNENEFVCVKEIEGLDVGYYSVKGVRIWLLDMAYPDQQVTVASWIKAADWLVKRLEKENKLPVVVGGTGFYIQGLVDGIETLGIKPDKDLREKMSKWPVKKIQNKLKKLAPNVFRSLNQSDINNPYRLIRKIEIVQSGEKEKNKGFSGLDQEVLKIGLKASRKELYKRIDTRVDQRLKQGLVDEIKMLLDRKFTWSDPGMNTLGYKEFKVHFENHFPLQDIVRRWKFDEHGYARRQLTWFKKDEKINWFDIQKRNWKKKMENLINQCYSENNE